MSTDNLAAALAAVQAALPVVEKTQTANTGKFSYRYASLKDVTAAVYPLLSKHGLAFTCTPVRNADGSHDLTGRLVHTSGESLEGSLPIAGASPQLMGGAITYMRRYLLGCMVGVVTDEDTDGPPPPADYPQQHRPERSGPHADQPITQRTRGRMFALLAEAGIEDEDKQRDGMSAVLGRTVESRGDLTEAEARQVVATLEARVKRTQEGKAFDD